MSKPAGRLTPFVSGVCFTYVAVKLFQGGAPLPFCATAALMGLGSFLITRPVMFIIGFLFARRIARRDP
jgi:hypothetical protein